MLDRRLRYDDGKGLGEGVLDTKRTPSRFFLLLESKLDVTKSEPSSTTEDDNDLRSYPSLHSHQLIQLLQKYTIVPSVRPYG